MHRVEWLYRKKWRVARFETPGEAYRFWLALKPGVLAKLFQNGVQKGMGR